MRYKKLDQCPPGMRKLLAQQHLTQTPGNRRRKYGNVRTEFNGEVFDSKAEAADDQRFRLLEAAGDIGGYARQVSIPLRARKGVRMRLDFMVNRRRPHTCTKCGNVDHITGLVLLDRKGVVTRDWENKRRILEAQLGIKVEILQD
jgi:hypothetical protein